MLSPLSALVLSTDAALRFLSTQLLIIDSLMVPFRAEFQGRGELSERQQKVRGALVTCAVPTSAACQSAPAAC